MSTICLTSVLVAAATAASPITPPTAAETGYYRMPAIHNDVVVFVAEGDLWRVGLSGGSAARLTTHLAEETNPAISPDGRTVAYTARYEGPAEVYTIPVGGGLPKQHSWEGIGATVVGWTADGRILYSTRRYSTLPNSQLVAVNPATNERTLVPLAQAADGAYDGRTLYFTRLPWQGSYTKRYKGGTAQNIWKWEDGGSGVRASGRSGEAEPLTADYKGTSKTPMVWNGRVYFASDREGNRDCKTVAGKQDCDWKAGVMNIWSMRPDGSDVRQHTQHKDFDVQSPALHDEDAAAAVATAAQEGVRLLQSIVDSPPAIAASELPIPEGQQRLQLEQDLDTTIDLQRLVSARNENDRIEVHYLVYDRDRVVQQWKDDFTMQPFGVTGRVMASLSFAQQDGDGTWQPLPALNWIARYRNWPGDNESGIRKPFFSSIGLGVSTMSLDFDQEEDVEFGLAVTASIFDDRILAGYGWNLQASERRGFKFFALRLFRAPGTLGRF